MHLDNTRPSTRPTALTIPAPARRAEDNALWLMSLADLMLVLIAFFVLLAVAEPSISQTAGPADVERPDAPSRAELPDPVRSTPQGPAVGESSDRAPSTPPAAPARPRQRRRPKDLIRTFMAAPSDQPTTDRLAPRRRLAKYESAATRQDRDPRPPAAAPAVSAPASPVPAASTGSHVQQVPSTATAPPPPPDTRQQATREAETTLRDIFRSAGDRVEISPGAGAVTVRLRDTITFDSASADLLPDVRPLLGRVAEWLATHPGIALEISGHTDDIPIATPHYPSNWELSAARAAAVARELLEGTAIDPRRAHIAGYGEHRPLDDAHGDRDVRARNRRVELRFLLPVNPTS